jgi:DNA-binding transcriptional MerR regulator
MPINGGSLEDLKFDRFLSREKEFIKKINKPQYRVGANVATYRTIKTWEEEGILEDTRKDEGWRKFSLKDTIWIELVKSLREFGLPLSKILKVKEDLIQTKKFEYAIWQVTNKKFVLSVVVFPTGKAVLADANRLSGLGKEFANSSFMVLDFSKLVQIVVN